MMNKMSLSNTTQDLQSDTQKVYPLLNWWLLVAYMLYVIKVTTPSAFEKD